MGKLLAIDFGTKRVGYAVSDATQTIAFPREALPAHPLDVLLAALREVINTEKISAIVIGLPLDAENEEGESAKKVRAFGEEVVRAFSLPVVYTDESYSSNEALSKIPLRKDRGKTGRRDAVAAQIILQRYLDSKEK